MFKKGQSGNPGGRVARKDKPFLDALMIVLNREHKDDAEKRKKLYVIAEKLADAALAGESWAIQQVADRIDGKPSQEVNATIEDRSPFVTMTDDELSKYVAARIADFSGSDRGEEAPAGKKGAPKPRGLH